MEEFCSLLASIKRSIEMAKRCFDEDGDVSEARSRLKGIIWVYTSLWTDGHLTELQVDELRALVKPFFDSLTKHNKE